MNYTYDVPLRCLQGTKANLSFVAAFNTNFPEPKHSSQKLNMSRTPSVTKFPYAQDAVRILAQGKGDVQGQSRRFSVDPQLTNVDILRNIIGRAFDIKGDFAVSYRATDDFGGETFLPMVSDWDLSAAFVSASDPDLQLMIEPSNIKINYGDGSADEEAWELIKSTEVIPPSPLPNNKKSRPKATHSNSTTSNGHEDTKNYGGPQAASTYTNPISFNTAGLFNTMERWVQKAKTFVEDISVVTTRPPLSDVEFRHYLDGAGILCRPKELRFACYHGGIEPSLRKVVWKHLLNVYPDGLTGNGRIEYIRNKAKDYYDLRDIIKGNFEVNEEIMCVSNMVRKDVLRTDRHLKYFSGHDDNQNIANLFNILTTYALNHPSVGYCQGMSDLASPLLVTMGDEAQAYICFCALMDRLKSNFSSDGLAMSLKFAHLAEAMAYYDNTFWRYLKSIGADDLLFCYRWLLLELKREFAFEDALRMMEVLWASLPYKPRDVPLYEIKFTGINSQSVPIPVPSLTSSYSKVCAIRRSSTASNSLDMRHRRLSRKPKQKGSHTNLSLDENSLASLSSSSTTSSTQSSHRKPFYSMDETMEILTSRELFNSSPFEILSLRDAMSPKEKPKLVKNLKEFQGILSLKGVGKGSTSSRHSSESSNVSSNKIDKKSYSVDTDLDININLHQSVFSDDEDGEEDDGEEISNTPKIDNYVFPKSEQYSNNLHKSSPPLCSHQEGQTEMNLHNENPRSTRAVGANSELAEEAAEKLQNTNGDSNNGDSFATPLDQRVDFCIDSENDSGYAGQFRQYCDETEKGKLVLVGAYESNDNSLEEPEFQDKRRPINKMLPPPQEFGGTNPFLMFLCLTLLLQHREYILRHQLDYNETAMYFDKFVRKQNLARVLAHARQMYANYMKQMSPRV